MSLEKTYTTITSMKQYLSYCNIMEQLVFDNDMDLGNEEVNLLWKLIQEYDSKNKKITK